jgi:hypothetical protein
MKHTMTRSILLATLTVLLVAVQGCDRSAPPSDASAGSTTVVAAGGTTSDRLLPFPPKPIKIGPGTGGNLEWTENGVPLQTNTDGEFRDDLIWRTEYLTARLVDNTEVAVEKVEFKVRATVNGNTVVIPVVLLGKNQYLRWDVQSTQVKLCSSKTQSCVDHPIPVEMTGELVDGKITVQTLGGSSEQAVWIEFKPLLAGYCS